MEYRELMDTMKALCAASNDLWEAENCLQDADSDHAAAVARPKTPWRAVPARLVCPATKHCEQSILQQLHRQGTSLRAAGRRTVHQPQPISRSMGAAG